MSLVGLTRRILSFFFFSLSRREMALEGKREIFGDIYFWAGSWRDGEGDREDDNGIWG